MRAHHAPTRFLLNRFTFKDREKRNGRSIWIYEPSRRPRVSADLSSECAEHGYFAGGDSGETEAEIDARFNLEYEVPFNKLLPKIDSDVKVLQSSEVRSVCARFVSHLFHRTKAARQGARLLVQELIDDYQEIANSPLRLWAYTAKLSAIMGRPVALEDVRRGILTSSEYHISAEGAKALYVNDIVRATGTLAGELSDMKWSVVRSGSSASFCISDTPIVSRSTSQYGNVSYGVGIRKPGTEWFLPISHNRLLRIAHTDRHSDIANDSEIAELNGVQIMTMSNRLYGRAYSSWIDDMVQVYGGKYKFHEDVFKGSGNVREDEFDDSMASLWPPTSEIERALADGRSIKSSCYELSSNACALDLRRGMHLVRLRAKSSKN